jgi:hypothetical protein
MAQPILGGSRTGRIAWNEDTQARNSTFENAIGNSWQSEYCVCAMAGRAPKSGVPLGNTMGQPADRMEQAERHVQEGELRVARQEVLIARLAARGFDLAIADHVLELLRTTLRLYRDHLRAERDKCGLPRDGSAGADQKENLQLAPGAGYGRVRAPGSSPWPN